MTSVSNIGEGQFTPKGDRREVRLRTKQTRKSVNALLAPQGKAIAEPAQGHRGQSYPVHDSAGIWQ
jgi:hypothetical protein